MAKLTLIPSKMTGLWRVKPNKALRWPKFIIDPTNARMPHKGTTNKRGGPGYVVNMDLPEEKRLVQGQERFLEQVPTGELEGAAPQDPATFIKPAVNWMIEHGFISPGDVRKRTAAQQVKENTQKVVETGKPPGKVLPGLNEPVAPKPEPDTKKTKAPKAVKPAGDEDPFGEEESDAVPGQEAAS